MAEHSAVHGANSAVERRRSPLADFWFTVDLRSAGLFRILLGLILVWRWWDRWQWKDVLFSAEGVLPASALDELRRVPHALSMFTPLEWLDESPLGMRVFFLAALFCFVAFLIGYRTRLFGVLSLLALGALVQRNSYALIGADFVLGSLMLWAQFLPLSRRFSMDALREVVSRGVPLPKEPTGDASQPHVPGERHSPRLVAAFGVVLQIGLIYFFTAAWKTVPLLWGESQTWLSGMAIHYVLHMEQSLYAPALWVRELPLWCLRVLSWGTLLAEYAALPMLLLPWAQPYLRRIVLLTLAGLHLGIAVTLDAGPFSYVMLASFGILLTGADWEWLRRKLARFSRPATVYYDDGCGVCARCCEILTVCDRFGRLSFIGSSDLAARRHEIPAGLAEKTVVVFDDRSGRMYTRAAAMAAALRGLPLPFHLFRCIAWPGIVLVTNVAYDLFARNRHHVSRLLGLTACQMPDARRQKSEGRGAAAPACTPDPAFSRTPPSKRASAVRRETDVARSQGFAESFLCSPRLAAINLGACVVLIAILIANFYDNVIRLAVHGETAWQRRQLREAESGSNAAAARPALHYWRQQARSHEQLNVIVNFAGAVQRWNMFAPNPPPWDQWWVVDGQREDGEHIDPLTGAATDFITQPSHSQRRFPRIWATYLQYGLVESWPERWQASEIMRREFCRYLLERYNRSSETGKRILRLEVYQIRLVMPAPEVAADEQTFKVADAGSAVVASRLRARRTYDTCRYGTLLCSYDPSRKAPFATGASEGDPLLVRRIIWYPSGRIYREGFRHVELDTDEGVREEHAPNGALYRGPVVRGQQHGHWQQYHPEGWLEQEGPWEHGVQLGTWRYYFRPPNGKLREKAVLQAGRRHGPAVLYYPDGTLMERGDYENDLRVGVWSFFNAAGFKFKEGAYQSGVPHGAWDYFHANGAPAGRKQFERGVLHGPWFEYYEDGKTLYQEGAMAGQPHGEWKKYHRSGKLAESGEYDHGQKTGVWKQFFETTAKEPDRLYIAEHYAAGKLHGPFAEHYPSGQVAQQGKYVNGQRVGLWQLFHENGRMAKQGEYLDDLQEGPWTVWFESGAKQEEGPFRRGEFHGKWTFWHEDGKKPKGVGEFAAGKQHGEWTFYHRNGQRQGQGRFEQGQQTGRWTLWNEQGSKSAEGEYAAGQKTGRWKSWLDGREVVETYRDGIVVEDGQPPGSPAP